MLLRSFGRDLYTVLWTLCLIIPGIVKSYEYKMIPYILAENPRILRKRAFEISKNMMDGEKWNAFVIDLSFIGWKSVINDHIWDCRSFICESVC